MKKAITPLVSTIMLLIFAIGLGVMVMMWGNAEKFKSYKGCADKISFTELGGQQQVCVSDGKINAMIENNGNAEVDRIKIIFFGAEDSSSEDYFVNLQPGEMRKVSAPLMDNKLLKVRFIPDNCVSSKIDIENIRQCQ